VLPCSAMMYFSVSRAWLFSRTAQRIYLLCAILDLALLGTQIAIRAAMRVSGVVTIPNGTRMVLSLLIVPEMIGTAVLVVGMTYCWLAIGGSCGRKLVWIFYIPWFVITMPVYYFAVYRRFVSNLDGQTSSALVTTADSTTQLLPSAVRRLP